MKKGYNEDEAKEIISKNQCTFSLDICIKKYGEIKGKEIFENRQNKWQKSLLENGKLKCGYSEISQELFYKILENYNFEDRKSIFFTTKNQEYFIKEKNKFFQYDYTDLERKKIIEYNGDMYHANPKIYESKDTPHPFRKWLTSKDIWEYDEEKINAAKENGFKVLVIWDSDYRKNPEKILQECLDFLK